MITLIFAILSVACTLIAMYYKNKEKNLLAFVYLLASIDFIKWIFWSRLPFEEMQQKVSAACIFTLCLVAVSLLTTYLREKRFFA